MKNTTLLLPVLILSTTVCCCHRKSDSERQISLLIDTAAALVEQKKFSDLMDLTSENLLVMPHRLDKRNAKARLFLLFQQYKQLSFFYPHPRINVEPSGNRASVNLLILIVRENEKKPQVEGLASDVEQWLEKVGDYTRLFKIEMKLILEKGDWLIREFEIAHFTGFNNKKP